MTRRIQEMILFDSNKLATCSHSRQATAIGWLRFGRQASLDSPTLFILLYNPLVMLQTANKHPNCAVVPLVLLFFFLALDSMRGDSPTMDEQNHLARGLAFLSTGDPRLSLEHPPLLNLLSALPLLTLPEIRLPTDHPSWERPEGWYEFADLLLWQYNHDVTRMLFLARMPILLMTIGLGVLAYHFARRMWGGTAAWPAMFLILFDPNIMAHGRYTTTDLGGTAFLFLAAFLLWRMWQLDRWSWPKWVWASVGLGFAFGSKLSALVFVPAFLLLALLPIYPRASTENYWPGAARRLSQFISAGLLSLLWLWAIFGLEWGTFHFQSQFLLPLNAVRGPMPTFWSGLEQIAGFTGGGRGSAFLLGRFSDQGFLAYFPVAFVSKTPIPTLLLLLLAIFLLLRRPQTRTRVLYLLLPALFYFLLSMGSALNIGYRHLLPILPFLLLAISGLAGEQLLPGAVRSEVAIDGRWPPSFTGKILPVLLNIALLSLLVSALLIHPHYLSYFNSAVGGPQNGYRILVDSNIDWGQDLLRLKQWMAENQVGEINLAWFGSADPHYYDINYRPLPGLGRSQFFSLWWDVPFDRHDPEPGVYAISVSNLWELPLRPAEKSVYAWFRARPPDARVGYSILIYEVH